MQNIHTNNFFFFFLKIYSLRWSLNSNGNFLIIIIRKTGFEHDYLVVSLITGKGKSEICNYVASSYEIVLA